MRATIYSFSRCPTCGYRNLSFRVGSIRPGMRRFTMAPGSLGFRSLQCRECGEPLGWESYDRDALAPETAERLAAWRAKQRAKQAARREARRATKV